MLVSSTIPSNLSIPHSRKKETVIDRNNHFYINAQCEIPAPYGSRLHKPAELPCLLSPLSMQVLVPFTSFSFFSFLPSFLLPSSLHPSAPSFCSFLFVLFVFLSLVRSLYIPRHLRWFSLLRPPSLLSV